MAEWKHVNITDDDLEALRNQARKNNRTPPQELHVVLQQAGVIPKMKVAA